MSTSNGRSNSPKYLLGESYGGFRAAKVAQTLGQEQGIVVSGVVMLSPLLDGGLTFGGSRLALGAALQLPSLAAAELERKGTFSKESAQPRPSISPSTNTSPRWPARRRRARPPILSMRAWPS